jgi:hypothetical protein
MSEASLRAAIPPHFSKESPCWPIYHELCGIHNKLKEIAAAKTHSMCARERAHSGAAAQLAPPYAPPPRRDARPSHD